MIVPRLIERKRDGGRLEPQEVREIVLAHAEGRVPDYQMAALLMAMYFRGLDPSEMNAMMEAMLESGKRLDLSRLPMARIDKHSTGGVGDKTSLILAPLIASLGVAVPMMSGRGLGHTGGTLDKLESIPGFRTALTLAEAEKQIARIGCAMLSQTEEIVPADRKLYALRDATATVEVIPLIAASIMSKKIAEDLTGLVLDIKRGSGSFLPKLEDELELAKAMINLGSSHGCPVVAYLTAMDRPLGHACGNALEVAEAIEVLKGGGPPDLIEVTMALGAAMLVLATVASTLEAAQTLMRDAINSGTALLKFEEIVAAQGGDTGVVHDPTRLPYAPHDETFVAKREGVVQTVDPRAIGYGVIALGGGRRNMEDKVDPSVGFVITAKPGNRVTKGQALATIHARSEEDLAVGRSILERAIVIGDSADPPLPLVSHRVTVRGVEQLA
ncbi:MAG TPA: thymidine phosphorylase [Gemmatimonadetes bacterium]|jgi:pyrimidine-nucleoside phosphorylase|nr:thymidine phosphorylase [Gemmatimonadota bacterium]